MAEAIVERTSGVSEKVEFFKSFLTRLHRSTRIPSLSSLLQLSRSSFDITLLESLGQLHEDMTSGELVYMILSGFTNLEILHKIKIYYSQKAELQTQVDSKKAMVVYRGSKVDSEILAEVWEQVIQPFNKICDELLDLTTTQLLANPTQLKAQIKSL